MIYHLFDDIVNILDQKTLMHYHCLHQKASNAGFGKSYALSLHEPQMLFLQDSTPQMQHFSNTKETSLSLDWLPLTVHGASRHHLSTFVATDPMIFLRLKIDAATYKKSRLLEHGAV